LLLFSCTTKQWGRRSNTHKKRRTFFSWKMNENRTNEWVWRWVVGVI
jgi:hypothetical protein